MPTGEVEVVSLDAFSDKPLGLSDCGVAPGDGPDLFVHLDAEVARQRWWVSATPSVATTDVVLHFMDGCSGRCGASQDLCGAGYAEGRSFQAPALGTFVLGVDTSPASAAGDIELLVATSACGNGKVELGEGCDDNNSVDNDGCSNVCTYVIDGAAHSAESESDPLNPTRNDSIADANLVSLDDPMTPARERLGTREVTGVLDEDCDVDVFAVVVDEGDSLTAEVTMADGTPCEPPGTGLELTLMDAAETTVVTVTDDGLDCPALDNNVVEAQALSAGLYHVALRAGRGSPEEMDYRLTFTVRDVP